MFRGTESLGAIAGYGPKSVGAICDLTAFPGVVEIASGVLGPRDGQITVDLVEPDGAIRRLAVTHADPAKSEIARKFKEYVPDPRKSEPLVHVLRSAQSIIEPDLPDSALVAAALDDEHLRMMRELQFRSVMIVPLLTLERTLGAFRQARCASVTRPALRQARSRCYFASRVAPSAPA